MYTYVIYKSYLSSLVQLQILSHIFVLAGLWYIYIKIELKLTPNKLNNPDIYIL